MNDATETLSIKALTFIASREDLLDLFIDACGITVNDLYENAEAPEVWAALLDFILSTDVILFDFCDSTEYTSQDIWRARNDLPGAPSDQMIST
ncbi:MAG: DUF3572 family protein [Alphaproteobacteria bacterium]|nr:DUF3572 family protein [Alphaproteobacteria bacterium]